MTLLLDSMEAKLRWAGKHAQSVKDEVVSWMNDKPYSASKKVNDDLTRYSVVFHVNKEPAFENWTLIIGDCVHNLRASLEHLIYAIAVHESGQVPPPDENRLTFPIADTPAEFKEFRNRIRTLSDPVRAAIEASQPYNRTNPHLPPLLAILRDLEKTDKHKLLRLAFAAISRGEFGFRGLELEPGQRVDFFFNAGELKDGADITAFTFDRSTPNVEYDRAWVDVIVALWHGPRDRNAPIGYTNQARTDFSFILDSLKAEVRTVINNVVSAVKL